MVPSSGSTRTWAKYFGSLSGSNTGPTTPASLVAKSISFTKRSWQRVNSSKGLLLVGQLPVGVKLISMESDPLPNELVDVDEPTDVFVVALTQDLLVDPQPVHSLGEKSTNVAPVAVPDRDLPRLAVLGHRLDTGRPSARSTGVHWPGRPTPSQGM